MMDLADELMNDLENDSGEEELELDEELNGDQEGEQAPAGAEDEVGESMIVHEGGIAQTDELDHEQVNQMELKSVAAVSEVAKLTSSRTMKDVLQVGRPHLGPVKPKPSCRT